MKELIPFSADQLKIDTCREAERIIAAIREIVFKQLRRKGVVVGLSGGIDSSVVAALSVLALGADRVVGLFMPEADPTDDILRLGRLVADCLGINTVLEDITPICMRSDAISDETRPFEL
jgi:NAD+ synthase